KASAEVGISSEVIELPIDTKEETLLNKIVELNNNDHVHGILVQLPLPSQIDEQKVIETIDPKKDVDGFHPINVGKMMQNKKTLKYLENTLLFFEEVILLVNQLVNYY